MALTKLSRKNCGTYKMRMRLRRRKLRVGQIPLAYCFKCMRRLRYGRRPHQCILRSGKIVSVPLGPIQARETEWNMPDGVVFRGGGNYGSSIYDSLIDGIRVELLVCDDCLRKHRRRLRHIYDETCTSRFHNDQRNGVLKKRQTQKQKPHEKKLLDRFARQQRAEAGRQRSRDNEK